LLCSVIGSDQCEHGERVGSSPWTLHPISPIRGPNLRHEITRAAGARRRGSASATERPAARGASLFKMMDVSRHKSVDTLRGYVRDADAFRDHAGVDLL
jgi:hypothetical protein